MKSILISIQPKWVAKILNGYKTIEIRKTIPKCELPCKVYIYCSKDKRQILAGTHLVKESWLCWDRNEWSAQEKKDMQHGRYNGHIVAEFILKEVETIEKNQVYNASVVRHNACLNIMQLHDYIKGKKFHAWHIDNLTIYEKPKDLNNFYKPCKHIKNGECYLYSEQCNHLGIEIKLKDGVAHSAREHVCCRYIKRAPQDWCYVEDNNGY